MMALAPWFALALIATDLPAPAGPEPRPHPAAAAEEAWQLTLPEAIRLSLENSEIVRCLPTGATPTTIGGPVPALPGPVATPMPPNALPGAGPAAELPAALAGPNRVNVTIARLNADGSVQKFQGDVEAHVRSVEQTYWALAAQQVILWSRETAVRLDEEILRSERAKAGGVAGQNSINVKEAVEQLESSRLTLVTATSDLMTIERQLRNIIGLPSGDHRRILPSTAPTATKIEPNWDASVKQMLAGQPDVVQQRELVAGASLAAALHHDLPEDKARAQAQHDRQQAHLQKVLHAATHNLSRYFLEVDLNFKQFEVAQRLRGAAQRRLESQRSFYDEGRITVDRVLDAVTQYANAISQEALYQGSYNTSLAALEEARGTLLAYEAITLDPGVAPRKATLAPGGASAPAPVPRTARLRIGVGAWNLLDIEVTINPPAAR